MRHVAVALPAVALLALFDCLAWGASPEAPLSKATARAPCYSFETLAEGISAVMSSEAEGRAKQWQVAALLSDYLGQGTLEEKFQRPNPRLPVTTYLLHTDPGGRFSIAALVFQAHARTTIHDHQSWVVWGTYRGKERETRYRRRDVVGRSFPELTPAWKRVFARGDVSFIDPPPGDIHDVENASDAVSVSLHVHATDIGKQARNSYDLRQKIVRSFVQSYEPATEVGSGDVAALTE